ncbi:MAG: hypothetical protein JWL65_1088 [Gammaproteobacteria bacterium]|nr:hypothetical protein [Gammaproteobacteria bacterium]
MNIGIDPSARLAGAALPPQAPALTKLAWRGGFLVLAAYCVMFVLLSPLPVQDFPDHLARAVALDDLLFHGGARFGAIFHFHLEWIPYLLGDLILTAAVAVLGVTGGAAFWILLVFLSLPCAALFYLRIRGIDIAGRSLALLLSVYFATDWFFLMGFLSFRVSVAMLIVTLGLVEMLRRKWSYPLFALYAAAVVLDYLMHLSPIIFLFAALAVSGLLRLWLRTTMLRTEFALFIPLLVVLAWHFLVGVHYREPTDPVVGAYMWGTWHSKFARIGSEFFHFVPYQDVLLVLLLAACLFARTGVPRRRDLRQPLVLELLVLAAMFVAMYFALPMGYAEAFYVDTRPLPYASFFFIAACLALPRPDPVTHPRREPLAFFLAALLAVGNLAYLARHFIAERAWVDQYRSVVASIPVHGRVLPVYTRGGEGSVVPFLHVSGFVSMDRAAVEPYVFAGDNGNPMKYFRYLHRPYDPPEVWYGDIPRDPVDWKSVARDYDFLVITKPFDPAVFKLTTRIVADNATATVLAIQK